jgi:hypothetical protein
MSVPESLVEGFADDGDMTRVLKFCMFLDVGSDF